MTPNNTAAPATATDDFNVPVPTEELERKPSFELMPAGWYETTLQSGAELVNSERSTWEGIRIPFAGFTSKTDGKAWDRERRFQVTTKSDNDKAREIGRKDLTNVAVAFGLAEETTVNGAPAQRMTAKSPAELVEQLNAVAGSPCDVYITAKQRKRDGKPVMRDDGKGPVMDNEISRVAALGAGK